MFSRLNFWVFHGSERNGYQKPTWIPKWFRRGVERLDRLEWKLRHRWQPRHQYNIIRTDLPAGYYDCDALMEAAMVKLLRRYVEEEMGGADNFRETTRELYPMAAAEEHKIEGDFYQRNISINEQILEIYEFFTIIKPHLEDVADTALLDWSEANLGVPYFEDVEGSTFKRLIPRPHGKDFIDLNIDLTKQIEDETTDMLIRLVKVRGSLWS